jgi:hypothetical protein
LLFLSCFSFPFDRDYKLTSTETLKNFPCADLRTIDQLWVKFSNGRFGFSIQKKIYLECGGKADGEYYKEAWEKFGDRVGWRVKGNWIDYFDVAFNTSPYEGHLPVHWEGLLWKDWKVSVSLFSRVETSEV